VRAGYYRFAGLGSAELRAQQKKNYIQERGDLHGVQRRGTRPVAGASAFWADELAAWANVRDTWDMLMFGLRLGKRPRGLVTSTPRPIALLKELNCPSRRVRCEGPDK
jgi:hypothetical protein